MTAEVYNKNVVGFFRAAPTLCHAACCLLRHGCALRALHPAAGVSPRAPAVRALWAAPSLSLSYPSAAGRSGTQSALLAAGQRKL